MNLERDKLVFCGSTPLAGYHVQDGICYPELPESALPTTSLGVFRSLLIQAHLDHRNQGSSRWNPLSDFIAEGQRVLIKPNWVHHHNGSGAGLESLVTHTSLLEAIIHYVGKTHPVSLVLGDAPIQGCDFAALMAAAKVPQMIGRFSEGGLRVQLKDFRRTIRPSGDSNLPSRGDCRPLDEFILYDLGTSSSLEEITTPRSEFRVTMYNPDALKRTHAPGKHQYLVARDVIESDVIINVPKLKTHKKACITGALKNLVGINGHKEYLPHHRKGGSRDGGDCYPGGSYFKHLVEDLLDATNKAQTPTPRWLLANAVRAGLAIGKLLNLDNDYEGSWCGNDTVWRMSLDLQRIVCYGRADGTLADSPQRTILSITDGIVAGEGEGPLAPTPVQLGMITFGTNTAAVEWINALLMGLLPDKIPITREAFAAHRYPLTDFVPKDIYVFVNGDSVRTDDVFARYGRAFRLPNGWLGPSSPAVSIRDFASAA